MRIDPIEPLLLSPCCWAKLDRHSDELRGNGTVLWRGTWTCQKCGCAFPHHRGVAVLSVIDPDWIAPLGELIGRRKIIQREMEQVALEPDRQKRLGEQVATLTNVMSDTFRAALEQLNISSGMRVLDVGAGLGETSAEFARRGAEVVATETEVSNAFWLSFAETDPEPPQSISVGSEVYHSKSPAPLPHYFTRMVAPAHRLPFTDASFDVVFCRSVLHHFHDLPRALHEMLRVLKPGGTFMGCSEPLRSILDREDHYLAGTVDKEDGMNEQAPTWLEYWRPLQGALQPVKAQAWPNPHRFESKRIFRRIPLDLHRRVPPGVVLEGWKTVKLLPLSATLNITGTRSRLHIDTPRRAGAGEPLSAHTLASLYNTDDLQRAVSTLAEGTEQLAEARRQLLAAKGGVPETLYPGEVRERDLRIGWRGAERRNGLRFRYTNRVALAAILRRAGASRLKMVCTTPITSAQKTSGIIRVNGAEVGDFEMQDSEWKVLEFPLSADTGPILDVEIVHSTLAQVSIDGTPTLVGIGVRSIETAF